MAMMISIAYALIRLVTDGGLHAPKTNWNLRLIINEDIPAKSCISVTYIKKNTRRCQYCCKYSQLVDWL